MVQHAQFIAGIANAFGETENTIKLVHRTLREAGYLHGLQGRHAPERTAEDAAVFLCWLGTTDKPSLGPVAVEDFGKSRRSGHLGNSERETLQRLGLPEEHSLLEMLAALVRTSANREDLGGYVIDFRPDELHVRVNGFLGTFGYSREHETAVAEYNARHAKPYRVTRTLPKSLIDSVAAIFAGDAHVEACPASANAKKRRALAG